MASYYKAPTKKQVAAFQAEAHELLSTLAKVAAVGTDEYSEYHLQTTAGALSIMVYDDWLACRFDNVALANEQVTAGYLNRCSGKWNWHGLDTIPAFKRALCEIL
jgi:hypothetical protein